MKEFNASNYKSTGNLSVDMAMNAVAYYRKMGRPLKTIWLSRFHYDRFDSYFKDKAAENGKQVDDLMLWTLDGVNIDRMNEASSETMKYEFWPTKRTETFDDLYFKDRKQL